MHETIQPSKICKALKYLIKTPLYVENNIKVDDIFFNNYEFNHGENVDFIVDPEDEITISNINNDDICNKIIDNEETNIFEGKLENLDKNEEVLIINRNEEITDKINIIAPGQGKTPIQSHEINNFDELCFPTVFGGQKFILRESMSYADRVLSEVRRSDRRSCNTTRLLFMAKTKLEKSVKSNMNKS